MNNAKFYRELALSISETRYEAEKASVEKQIEEATHLGKLSVTLKEERISIELIQELKTLEYRVEVIGKTIIIYW